MPSKDKPRHVFVNCLFHENERLTVTNKDGELKAWGFDGDVISIISESMLLSISGSNLQLDKRKKALCRYLKLFFNEGKQPPAICFEHARKLESVLLQMRRFLPKEKANVQISMIPYQESLDKWAIWVAEVKRNRDIEATRLWREIISKHFPDDESIADEQDAKVLADRLSSECVRELFDKIRNTALYRKSEKSELLKQIGLYLAEKAYEEAKIKHEIDSWK
ncbi:MAG: hypothetical protein WC663_01925 [Patescibacteria group bacterium]|jgi:hypothetical protein